MVMQFGDFLFPYNPKSIQVLNKRNVKSFITVSGRQVVHENANSPMKVVCRGQFFGDEAKGLYDNLRDMCRRGGAYVLSIPEHSPFYAVCTNVEFFGAGAGDIIEYSAEFLEKE